jgi:CRISPR-associated protein Csd1
MILQALKEYYDRKSLDPESDIAPMGWEWKEIPLLIVINEDGLPVSYSMTYEGEGKKRRAKKYLVPQGIKRAVNVAANLLWDNPEYCLGLDLKGRPDRVIEQHRVFLQRIAELGIVGDPGIESVMRFLATPDHAQLVRRLDESITSLLEEGPNMTFQLLGDSFPVFARPRVKQAIDKVFFSASAAEKDTICLITGEIAPSARLHDAIKGVWGAQSIGANIISFNLDAFCSYNKSQGANASISIQAMTAYTKALNALLDRDSSSRMQVGDASTIFWAEKNDAFAARFSDFFNEPSKDDPEAGVRAVKALFQSIDSGALSQDNADDKFYVLGLSPNASRVSIRFWVVDTVRYMSEKIAQHFKDLQISHGPREKDVLSLFRLLIATAPFGKSENIPPSLAGEVIRSVLQGLPYPHTLLQAVVRRIRAEHEITYPRAAMIKACINRSLRSKNSNNKEELNMSLDEQNRNIGYRLGRLFATLERVQSVSHPGINATIRDRFYGSASGTPSMVFGNLMRLKNHHLSKLDSTGQRIYFEKLISSILDGVEAKTSFPPHLSLEDQGRFAVGYYHQMQDFFTKKENKNQGENHE